MNIRKSLSRRSKRVFQLADGVKAKEFFQFRKKHMMVRRRDISLEEALERLDRGKEVYVNRSVLVERTRENTVNHRDPRREVKHEAIQVHDRSELEQQVKHWVSSPFPQGLYHLDSKKYLPQEAIRRAAEMDKINYLDVRLYRHHFMAHHEEVLDLMGERGPEFVNQREYFPKPESGSTFLEDMRKMQSAHFLNDEFEQAAILTDGAAFLEQNGLHTDPEMAFALLVDEVAAQKAKPYGEVEDIEEARAELRNEASRAKLFLDRTPEIANSAKAYHALASAFKAAEGGIFSPVAPLVNEVLTRLDDLRISSKKTPKLLGQIAHIDEAMKEADEDETITEFFHRVKHSTNSRRAMEYLSPILSKDFGSPDDGSKLSDGTAIKTNRESLENKVLLVSNRMEEVSTPELLGKLQGAKDDLEKRLARLNGLEHNLALRRDEEVVFRTVSEILNDKSVEQFVERADENRVRTLVDSRTNLSVAQLEKLPLVGPMKHIAETVLPEGYLSRGEILERLSSLQVESLESGDSDRAYNLEGSKVIIRELGASHNGQMYDELSERYDELGLGGSIESDESEKGGKNDAFWLRRTYNAVKTASSLSSEYEKRSLPHTDLAKRMETLIEADPGNLVLRERIGRTKLLMAHAGGEGTVNTLISYAYKTKAKSDLKALAQVLDLNPPQVKLEKELGLKVPGNSGSIKFYRVRLEQLQNFLKEKASTTSSTRIQDEIILAQKTLDEQSKALDQLSARLVAANEEASINALLEDISGDDSTDRLISQTRAEMLSVVSKAEADAEIAKVN